MGEKGLSAKEEAFMLQELKMKSLQGHAASIIIALALAAGLLWGDGLRRIQSHRRPEAVGLFGCVRAERAIRGGGGIPDL